MVAPWTWPVTLRRATSSFCSFASAPVVTGAELSRRGRCKGMTTMYRCVALAMVAVAVACRAAPAPTAGHATTPSARWLAPTSTPGLPVLAPPVGSQLSAGGCGQTPVYSGGELPEWATINAPRLPYVVGKPGIVIGYLFTPRLAAGDQDNNKILWYVATPRDGQALVGEGHPLDADAPVARFTKAADSSPGEIYPSGPTVPSPGCWRFTLAWLGGRQHAEVDLTFT